MAPLNRHTLPVDRLIGAPAPDRVGIVHLGIGNFHRAHAAVNTALAMAAAGGDWGILGVANRSRRIVDPLSAQDGLYSILQLSPAGEGVGLVDVHRGTLVAATDGPDVVRAIADPGHRIVTLTISEKGYHRSAATGRLDVEAPEVRADLARPDDPRTPLGQLARGLVLRHAQSQAPVSVLSCDNMQSAGTTSRRMVEEFLTAAGVGDEVLDWLRTSVTFPNAMVDRIVPGTTEDTRRDVERLLGLRDEIPVPAEAFTMWVLEDRFAAGRPAWEAAGAIFTDEVEAYELVKLRLLNGSHSLISYLGALAGRETIPAARAEDFVADSVRAAIEREYLPSIALPSGFDADAYVAQLFDRWSNTALGDRIARVGSDGSAKLLQRIPGPALRMLERGEMPHEMALTAAAWICCVAPPTGFDPGPVAAAMEEPAREGLARATAGTADVAHHVSAIFGAGFFPEDLAAESGFVDRVAELATVIVGSGVRAAAREALAAAQGPAAAPRS